MLRMVWVMLNLLETRLHLRRKLLRKLAFQESFSDLPSWLTGSSSVLVQQCLLVLNFNKKTHTGRLVKGPFFGLVQ